MKIIQIVAVVFFILLSACSYHQAVNEPALSSINIIDRDGLSETFSSAERLKQYENVDFCKNQPYQKVLRVYSRNANGDIIAYITSYHPNGQLKQYLEVINNRAYGKYEEHHENGKLKVQGFIIGGVADIDTGAEKTWLFHGKTRAWDEDGHLIAEIPYLNGELEGVCIHYHANGKIWKKIPCAKGQISGMTTIYLSDGSLFQDAEYVEGMQHGKSHKFWDINKIASEEEYDKGKLFSGKYYDKNDKLLAEISNGKGFRILFGKEQISEMQEFQNGIQEGLVKIFNNRGLVASTHNIQNGTKHGEEVIYYEGTLNPKLSVSWVNGKIQGAVKSWYSHGMPESRREMSNNAKNGLLTAWYKDGSLMMVEEYENDKLMRGEYFFKGERNPASSISSGNGIATLHDGDGNFVRRIHYTNGKPES